MRIGTRLLLAGTACLGIAGCVPDPGAGYYGSGEVGTVYAPAASYGYGGGYGYSPTVVVPGPTVIYRGNDRDRFYRERQDRERFERDRFARERAVRSPPPPAAFRGPPPGPPPGFRGPPPGAPPRPEPVRDRPHRQPDIPPHQPGDRG